MPMEMDELSAKLGQLLNSPEGMKQVQDLASMLGLAPGQNPENTPPPAQNNPGAALSMLGQGAAGGGDGLPGFDPQMLITLQKAFSAMNQPDEKVALLQALRPLLSEERGRRGGDAIRIMQLIRMLPLLKDSGLFQGFGE